MATALENATRGRSIRSYQRRIKALKDLLRDVTWVQPIYNGAPSCSCCGQMKHHGHADDCDMLRLEMY